MPDIWKPRGSPKAQVLKRVHELFISDLIDDHGTRKLDYMRKVPMKQIFEVNISRAVFYLFVREKYALSLKKVQLISEYRNSK